MSEAIQAFLADLTERTAREETEWWLTPIGRIQTMIDGRRFCPLAFWTRDQDRYEHTAQRMGMRKADIQAVMDAADNFTSGALDMRSDIRVALLKATGLA